jgi:hypothetical protein
MLNAPSNTDTSSARADHQTTGRGNHYRPGLKTGATVGLPDEFLLAGALPTLHDRYGISTSAMVNTIKARL